MRQPTQAGTFWGMAAVIIAAAALWVALSHPHREAPPLSDGALGDRNGAPLAASVAALEQRVAALEQRAELIPEPLAARAPVEGPSPSAPKPEALEALEERVARLEAELRARPAAPNELVPAPAAPAVLTAEERQQQIDTARALALDASSSEEQRLTALRQLRGLGEGARNGDVALAMIQLAQTSEDPDVRADVWRQMHRAKDPALVQPLLQALLRDPDSRVRGEAAETLGDFAERAEVRNVLLQAQSSEQSESVKREIARTLAGGN